MPVGLKPKNKLRRQAAFLSIKKAREAAKRDERFRRKREEAKDLSLRAERQARNVPATIDSKRAWDEDAFGDEEDALGWVVDVERLAKRRRLEQAAAERTEGGGGVDDEEDGTLAKLRRRDEETGHEESREQDGDADSMLGFDSEAEDDASDPASSAAKKRKPDPPNRASSPTTSSATNLELSPEFLKQKFPAIFNPPPEPKILVTTSLHSSLHAEAEVLTTLFPNSTYIRRTAHAHAHKYSVREIAQFASARDYTALVILMQAHHEKKPDGLDIVILPSGPHFHFSISNWVEGKKLPGHGVDQGFIPELILNNFRTPLGLLTAHLFRGLYPQQPELIGRTVVTLHNQRDYIFLRRHRYVFRDKKETEKSVIGTDGKPVKGVESIKVGMQELGPRFTLKLRRVDRGIQWKSGQEWQWKAGMEKQRTRFNM
ncbi:Brix-domain-containing protein [Trematosphaeria pertusa]|uniref:Brix-domain-containing protein n=1 Tax=Trematosphaeria pertusa TaxID=390896 RepID=A0A6A6HQM6_9PLEO|nr:Brix-domain-containing protein [Trematosphaeria pertusa]KAF2240317.1 Brix-domain-containing protein [Trematosphaeria pertusa]